jgi:large subunit ribosomal protein L13
MTTRSAKADEVNSKWYLADADGKVLGRFASQVAALLRGKHKPIFTTHLDTGDHVVIVNAEKIRVTGSKLDSKIYTRYTGYPGGLRKRTLGEVLERRPEFALEHAIRGMLPKNKLGRKMMKKVRIYAGPDHQHQGQKPEPIEL